MANLALPPIRTRVRSPYWRTKDTSLGPIAAYRVSLTVPQIQEGLGNLVGKGTWGKRLHIYVNGRWEPLPVGADNPESTLKSFNIWDAKNRRWMTATWAGDGMPGAPEVKDALDVYAPGRTWLDRGISNSVSIFNPNFKRVVTIHNPVTIESQPYITLPEQKQRPGMTLLQLLLNRSEYGKWPRLTAMAPRRDPHWRIVDIKDYTLADQPDQADIPPTVRPQQFRFYGYGSSLRHTAPALYNPNYLYSAGNAFPNPPRPGIDGPYQQPTASGDYLEFDYKPYDYSGVAAINLSAGATYDNAPIDSRSLGAHWVKQLASKPNTATTRTNVNGDPRTDLPVLSRTVTQSGMLDFAAIRAQIAEKWPMSHFWVGSLDDISKQVLKRVVIEGEIRYYLAHGTGGWAGYAMNQINIADADVFGKVNWTVWAVPNSQGSPSPEDPYYPRYPVFQAPPAGSRLMQKQLGSSTNIRQVRDVAGVGSTFLGYRATNVVQFVRPFRLVLNGSFDSVAFIVQHQLETTAGQFPLRAEIGASYNEDLYSADWMYPVVLQSLCDVRPDHIYLHYATPGHDTPADTHVQEYGLGTFTGTQGGYDIA